MYIYILYELVICWQTCTWIIQISIVNSEQGLVSWPNMLMEPKVLPWHRAWVCNSFLMSIYSADINNLLHSANVEIKYLHIWMLMKLFVYLFECVGCWLHFLWICTCSSDRVYICKYMYWSQCQAIILCYTMYVVLSIQWIKCLMYIGQLNSILLYVMDFFIIFFTIELLFLASFFKVWEAMVLFTTT